MFNVRVYILFKQGEHLHTHMVLHCQLWALYLVNVNYGSGSRWMVFDYGIVWDAKHTWLEQGVCVNTECFVHQGVCAVESVIRPVTSIAPIYRGNGENEVREIESSPTEHKFLENNGKWVTDK